MNKLECLINLANKSYAFMNGRSNYQENIKLLSNTLIKAGQSVEHSNDYLANIISQVTTTSSDHSDEIRRLVHAFNLDEAGKSLVNESIDEFKGQVESIFGAHTIFDETTPQLISLLSSRLEGTKHS